MWQTGFMSVTKRTKQMNFFVYVDTVVFTINPDRSVEPRDRLEVLVMQRPERPDKNQWALPGGLVGDTENLKDTSIRKVREETGIALDKSELFQVGAFGDPERDNRYRAIAIAYVALVPRPGATKALMNSDKAEFIPFRKLISKKMLEFDHAEIIKQARQTAENMLEDTPVALLFCENKFTISDLRGVYESFLQYKVDPANFRRKVDAVQGFVLPLKEYSETSSSPGRPALMYKPGSLKTLPTPIRFRNTDNK
jgi:8-oxo-dGTP diphosphatase